MKQACTSHNTSADEQNVGSPGFIWDRPLNSNLLRIKASYTGVYSKIFSQVREYAEANKNIFNILSMLFFIVAFTSCEDKIYDEYRMNVPLYMSYNELRTVIGTETPREINQPGKIYIKDNYLFVNEYMKGIHIIDNTNPASPQKVSFVEIPGNVDMAVKDNFLYADSYIDLIVIDLSDMNNITEISRVDSIFPYIIPEYDYNYPVEQIESGKGVVTGFEVKTVEKNVETNQQHYPMFWGYRAESLDMVSFSTGNKVGGGGSSYGTGGSMARFMLYADKLYAIDNTNMHIFDVTTGNNPLLKANKHIGWNIETLFYYNERMFIGTQTGMLIYSLDDPVNPEKISEFSHIRSCDPVVVEGDYAYVTLRSGSNCGGMVNELDVVDISNIYSPSLVKAYAMVNPHGLGIDDNILFLCDGEAGLKIYDARDPMKITENELKTYDDIHAFDVIPVDGVLIMTGEDGICQYDYADINNINLLSRININVEP